MDFEDESVEIPELKELIINIKYFTTIVQLLIKIKNDSLDLNIIRRSIDIFSELENEAGLEIVYDKLVAFLTKNKNYEEAIIFNKLLINCNFTFFYSLIYLYYKCKRNIENIYKLTPFSTQMKPTI